MIRAGDKYEVLHSNDFSEMALATPAPIGDRLILRTENHPTPSATHPPAGTAKQGQALLAFCGFMVRYGEMGHVRRRLGVDT